MFFKIPYCLSQRLSPGIPQVIFYGVLPNQQRQFNLGHVCDHPLMPSSCALWSRRKMASLSPTGIAKPHGHNPENPRIIKLLLADIQPPSEFVPAGIIPGNSRSMHPGPRSLAYYQDFTFGMNGKYRTGTKWQRISANRTSLGLRNQPSKTMHWPTYRSFYRTFSQEKESNVLAVLLLSQIYSKLIGYSVELQLISKTNSKLNLVKSA